MDRSSSASYAGINPSDAASESPPATRRRRSCESAPDSPGETGAAAWGRQITQLPDELLQHIFSFSSARDLSNVSLTCQRFKRNADVHMVRYAIRRVTNEIKSLCGHSEDTELDKQTAAKRITDAKMVIDQLMSSFLGNQKKVPLDTEAYVAIAYADKSSWGGNTLSAVIQLLNKGDQTNEALRLARDKVYRAACKYLSKTSERLSKENAKPTSIFIKLLSLCIDKPAESEFLDQQLSIIKMCCSVIEDANKTSWERKDLINVLSILSDKDQTNVYIHDAVNSICSAIADAKTTEWEIGELTEALDVLYGINMNNYILFACKAVCSAIASVCESKFKIQDIIHTLNVLSKGDQTSDYIRLAQNKVYSVINNADKSEWTEQSLTEVLRLLTEQEDTTNSFVVDAITSVYFAMENAT